MKIFGWGKDEAKSSSDQAAAQAGQIARGQQASAIDRARAAQNEGGIGGAATRLIERLLDTGIDGKGPMDSAAAVAQQALASKGDPNRAIAHIHSSHKNLATAGGFLTGLGGFVTMPVALPANVLEFYLLATRMTAATAKIRGYDIDQPEIRSAILLTLVGADSEDLLKKAGIQAATGGRLASMATERLPGAALMVLNKAVGFRLLGRVGQSGLSRLGRAVPLAGGAIGAGLDRYLMDKIADQALKEFPPLSGV